MPKGVYIRTKVGYWAGKKRPDISARLKGIVLSEETKEKLRQAKLKNPPMYWLGKKRPEMGVWIIKANKGRVSKKKGKKFPQYGGKNHYLWIEDRSLLKDDHRDRGGQLHREWSKNIKNRDGWKCKIFNTDCFGKVVAHHILAWRDYPELRYQLNNGITLCQAHHPRKRAEEKRLVPVFQGLVPVSKDIIWLT